jgi:Do/DeqQ family serine protease
MNRGPVSKGVPLVLFVFFMMGVASSGQAGGGGTPVGESPDVDVSQIDALKIIQNGMREIARKIFPVVVEVNPLNIPDVGDISPLDFLFGSTERMQNVLMKQGLGSGVIVKRSGTKVYVLTNSHVVRGGAEISIRLRDKRVYKTVPVGSDRRTDLALLVFETSEDLPVAELGNSDKVQEGDLVFTVGNPFGFDPAIGMGIVSAVGRKKGAVIGYRGLSDYIQTDAAVNRGNSGGALVNIQGEVIGINTFIPTVSGASSGFCFSVPINVAKAALDDLITTGRIDYGWLGINVGDPLQEAKRQLGLENRTGAFVFDVFKGSPADRGGLLPGDFIVSVNGNLINDAASLLFTITDLPIGKVVEFGIIRYGEDKTLRMELSARSEEDDIARRIRLIWPGMSLLNITEELHRQLNLPKKMGEVIVGRVTAGGPAWAAGLRPGDVVKELNGSEVKSMLDFYRTLNTGGGASTVRVYRKGAELTIDLQRP